MFVIFKKFLAEFIYRIINSEYYNNLVNDNLMSKHCEFKYFGIGSALPESILLKNPQYISIGENFSSLNNLRIEAWDEYAGQKFQPEIFIGNNVNINCDVHIGCINKVSIGNNVLLASKIYISDHSHGQVTYADLSTAPAKRELFSRGPVVIEDNVWVGEGACIMPGVTIGKNSIIGANSVVTKDVPSNSVAAGVPAKVIRRLL